MIENGACVRVLLAKHARYYGDRPNRRTYHAKVVFQLIRIVNNLLQALVKIHSGQGINKEIARRALDEVNWWKCCGGAPAKTHAKEE